MKAYFAGGCFWCVTPIYQLYGVEKVTCGYCGGDEENPSYDDVKAQKTGHRETIMLDYDPKVVDYDLLLDIYFENIDPYDGGGQFIDRGFSYSPAIFYVTEEERQKAEDYMRGLQEKTGRVPAVSLEPYKKFWPAEEEHQDYYLKNPEEFEEELLKSGRKKQ